MQRVGDPLQATKQRQRNQHNGADRGLEKRQPSLRDRVCGRLAMGVDADPVGKLARHRTRVLRHVAHLTPGQPVLEPYHQQQECDEGQ